MKAYAELVEENDISYRKITVLQFGDSWDLIGSAVLKNPGSANPLKLVDKNIFDNLLLLNDQFERAKCHEFSIDSSMVCIEKIFKGYYIGENNILNGVILLFNLYYIKDQHIVNARKLITSNDSFNLFPSAEKIIPLFKNRPVFLGWRFEYLRYNKSFAEKIFEFVSASSFMYLKRDMIDNNFYHPLYIQMHYKTNEEITKTLRLFYDQGHQN